MVTKAKKQGFVAQIGKLASGVKYTGAGAGTFEPGEIAAKILPGLRGGQLFAYCFRRFGYPHNGWDDQKELVRYRITTPLENVFLEIRPYMGDDYEGASVDPINTELMFGYVISKDIEDAYAMLLMQGKRNEWKNTPLYTSCVEALEAAIRDLLRPVYVRDVPINCYGRMDDSKKFPVPEVEAYHAAGYPIPLCFFEDTERWEAFTDALITLGNGNMGEGIESVIKTAATVKFYKGDEADSE